MHFVFNDGARAAAGYRGHTGDCVCRSIAIATNLSYQDIYDALTERARSYAQTHRNRVARDIKKSGPTPRDGMAREIYHPYLIDLGWHWTPTMQIGQGCRVHLCADELPAGRLVVSVSRHITAVIDGVIDDIHDCSRNGTRCVYGYYRRTE